MHLWKVGSKDSGLEIVNIIKAKLFHLKQSGFTKFSIRLLYNYNQNTAQLMWKLKFIGPVLQTTNWHN